MTSIEHPEVSHGLPVLTLPGADDVLDTVDPAGATALPIGPWGEDDYSVLAPVVELLVSSVDRFPDLRALFLGDVVGEECEVSWLAMCDITPVLEAFPLLEELTVRGGGDGVPEEAKPELRPVRHGALKSLTPLALDPHHHYLTEPLTNRFRELCAGAGTRLDLDGADYWDPEAEEPRYVAVSE